ncbi:MAG: tetratricopeptide repeat protein [Novosphingobium sp.]
MARIGLRPVLACGAGAALWLALGSPLAADPAKRDAALGRARAALAREDGVAAEIALRQAQDEGADRVVLAASMGEAFLLEGNLAKAREWLGPGEFAAKERAQGLRMLARLQEREGNRAAARASLERAIQIDKANAEAWVDLAQLRYRSGEQFRALDALYSALRANPDNLRALDFQGLIVRDQYGAEAALPWFERGLLKAPKSGILLGNYAATLGEMGRYRQMLVITRRMLELGVAEPRAHYLQAVLAARAGNFSLARTKLNKLGDGVKTMPSAMMLSGLLDLEGDNANLAVETFGKLVDMQPQNDLAQMLLLRALYAAGQQKAVIDRYSAWAQSPVAPVYVLEIVARAHEDLGQRDRAAPLLDRAAAVNRGGLVAAFDFGKAGNDPIEQAAAKARLALIQGRAPDAVQVAESLLKERPGMGAAYVIAGDARYAAGDLEKALRHYGEAARIRRDDTLLVRLALSAAQEGKRIGSAQLVAAHLGSNPQSPAAVRFAADYSASIGDWMRARMLLSSLAKGIGARDVRLLCDLAFAQVRSGDIAAASDTARRALALQPASPVAAQALVMALQAGKTEPALVEGLKRRLARP